MKSLLDQFDETVCLIEPRGLDRICVEVLETRKELRVVAELGRVQPIYSGASGRVLLASLPENEMLAILDQIDLLPLTPQSVTDRAQYLNELSLARKQGYAYAADQVIVGSAGVSAPSRIPRDESIEIIVPFFIIFLFMGRHRRQIAFFANAPPNIVQSRSDQSS